MPDTILAEQHYVIGELIDSLKFRQNTLRMDESAGTPKRFKLNYPYSS